jgi:hypothetical protein
MWLTGLLVRTSDPEREPRWWEKLLDLFSRTP